MIYTQKINIDFQVKSLEDLPKLKPFLEDGTLKVNKSQIARELGKDRRTVDKYLNGYEKPTTRHKGSPIDAYYDIIKELLSDENQQIFYYKRVLWQFLKVILSILVDTFISKISLPMQPVPEIGSISVA